MPSSDGLLLAVERQRIILDILDREGTVRTAELKEILHVSVATIRADLRELASTGACEVIWGGAVSKERPAPDGDARFWERSKLNVEAKSAIGARAAQLIEDGQTIIVDSGSTTVKLIRNFPRDWEYLRVVTPALDVAAAAAQYRYIELIMTGGVLRNRTRSLIGPQVLRSLETFNADWVFLACGGFSLSHGVTVSNILEAEVKRTMVQRGAKTVLMADSSKFGKILSLSIVSLNAINILVTDKNLSDADCAVVQGLGVDVLRA